MSSADNLSESPRGPDISALDDATVILPYFNRADTLHESAVSVLAQTHINLRLIMVNDGSTDGSDKVARSLTDARVEHVDSERNIGACRARNAGLTASSTSLVAFMDSDDYWLPQKLEQQIRYLRNHQESGVPVSVVGCGWRYQGRLQTDRAFPPGPFTRQEFFHGVPGTGTPMLLIDRAAAATASFDPSFPSLEERDFILSSLANSSLLMVVPEILATVRRGRGDHLANPVKTAQAWERYLTKYGVELGQNEGLLSWYHFRAAREHLVAGHRRAAGSHVRLALAQRGLARTLHLVMGALGKDKGLSVAQRVVPL